jgi:acyl-CoA synthetase (AMP-forming)/AMP-acid ligase II
LIKSGTTGFPKGALLSHTGPINTAYLDIYTSGLIEDSKVIGCPIPIFHSFGLIAGLIEPFIIGSKSVFPHFFPDTNALLKAIHDEKITALKGAPVIFIDCMFYS